MDYSIARFRDGAIGIFVESDWAALRGCEERACGMVEVFRTPAAARAIRACGRNRGIPFRGKRTAGTLGYCSPSVQLSSAQVCHL